MIYGYEVVNNGKGDPFVKVIDQPDANQIKEDVEGGKSRADVLVELLNLHVSNRRLRIAGIKSDIKTAKTMVASKKKAVKQAGADKKDKAEKELTLAQGELSALKRGKENALKPGANPIDPLRDAVIAIDEADLLFKADNEIGDRVEMIERAIFHSYAVSGKNAVRLVLGTATPAHTDVRSTFRLLNVLVTDADKRVHGVGTPGTDAKVNPDVTKLAGDDGTFQTSDMSAFMAQIRNGISRVNVTQDTDHFPIRTRTDVSVPVPGAFRESYGKKLLSRIPRIGVEDNGGEDKTYRRSARKTKAAKTAVDKTADHSSDEDEAPAVPAFVPEGAAAAAPEQEGVSHLDAATKMAKTVQKGLTQRGSNMRRDAMLLPDPTTGKTSGVPVEYVLGHKSFDAASVERSIAGGYMPKVSSLLDQIATIDAQHAAQGKQLPKHAIITATPLDYGAPLIGAGLAAAGYYWRPMRRDPDKRIGISFVHPSETDAPDPSGPWQQHAVGSSPSGLLPAPRDASNAAFVVLHDSLLDMNLERRGGSRTGRIGFRAYSDFVVASKTRLERVILTPDGSDPMEVGAISGAIKDIAGRPVYVDPTQTEGDQLFFTRASVNDLVPDIMTGLRETSAILPKDIAFLVARQPTLDNLLDSGIVEWAPTLSEKQKTVAAGVVTSAFNDRDHNFNGELARIIVVSPAFATGIDLAEVEYVHLLDPTERVSEGVEGVVRTRDRIQAEGRSWRRCGHKGIRALYGGGDTNVTILSYLLEGVAVDGVGVIDAIRSKRPSVVPVSGDPERRIMHVDDVVTALVRDPAEQQAMSNIRDMMAENAFDSVVNTPKAVDTPVYTGYVTVAEAIPLYRAPGAMSGFVTADNRPWTAQDVTTLFELWRSGAARFDPRLGSAASVPDIEQGAIETEILASLNEQLAHIIYEQSGQSEGEVFDVPDAETLVAERAEAYVKHIGTSTQASQRKILEDAYSIMGIQMLFDTSRQTVFASFDKDNKTPLLRNLVNAQLRSKYAEGKQFDIRNFLPVVLGSTRDVAGRFMETGGKPLAKVLATAGRMGATRIGSLVNFFSTQWGIIPTKVIGALGKRPMVPGESVAEYRVALFQRLSGAREGRWRRMADSAQVVFLRQDIVEKVAQQEARLRINIALSIAASRDNDTLDPISRNGAGGLHDASWEMLRTLDGTMDYANYTVAYNFALAFVEDLQSSGSAAPTDLYSRMSRIAQRLGLGEFMPQFVAYFMMFSVVAVREQSEARNVAGVRVVSVKRGEELQPALTLLLANTPAGDKLVQHLAQFADSRNNTGLHLIYDGVRALLDTDADWDATTKILVDLALEGEHETGLEVSDGVTSAIFLDGDGQQLLYRYAVFDRKARSASLQYYKRETSEVRRVDNVKDKSWFDSIGIWIAAGHVRVVDMEKARAMFGASEMNDVVKTAVLRIIDDTIPLAQSGRGRARDYVVRALVSAARQGTTTIESSTIKDMFNDIWQTAGSPVSSSSFFAQSKEEQRKVLGVYGRGVGKGIGVRLWTSMLTIANTAEVLFQKEIPDIKRRVMYAMRAEYSPMEDFAAVDVSDDEALAGTLLIKEIQATWATQYFMGMNSVAFAVQGVGDSLSAAAGKDRVEITLLRLIQWFITTGKAAPTIAEIGTYVVPAAASGIYEFFRPEERKRVGRGTIANAPFSEQLRHWASFVASEESEAAAADEKVDDALLAEIQQARASMEEATAGIRRQLEDAKAAELSEELRTELEARETHSRLQGVLLDKEISKTDDTKAIAILQAALDQIDLATDTYSEILGAETSPSAGVPEGDVEMTSPSPQAQLETFTGLPLRIVEPPHLAGKAIPPHIAERFVWAKTDDVRVLRVASGYAELREGAVLDAWKENTPILAEHFG